MQIQIKSKRTVMIAAVLTAAIIMLTGAFAWSCFIQQRINTFTVTVKPGVNLHDDFDGIDKDVYVENSGDIGIFVRVRLTEYLETVGQGSLVAGLSRGDEQTETDLARRSWTPHNALGENGHEYCVLPSDDAVSPEWQAGANFHDYYIWTMGGQKYYKPAKKLLTPEEYDAEPPVICNDLDPDTGKVKQYDGSELDLDGEPLARETLFAQVMTMEQWIAGGREIGAFWVIDTDGWCYWVQMLNPEEATGLLLDKVERTAKQFDSNVEYCINVWLQAVDEMDAGNLSVPENGGITDNGKLLMQLLTQELLLGDDGYYQDNGNGTFSQISDSDGKPAENAKPFIPIGSGVEQLDNVGKINAPDRLYIDDMLTLTRLAWDGTDYINFTDFDGDAPYYNIGIGDETVTIIGVETGEADGVLYLRLSNGTYLASVTKDSPYRQSYPGTGPFAVIYPGEDGAIGTGDDMRYNIENYRARYFYHIGNGIYVEVADKNSTASYDVCNDSTDGNPDDNTIYYFSNTIYSGLYEINNLIGGTLEENVEAAFVETLQIGEFFAYHDAPNTGYATIYKGEDIDAQRALGRVSRTFTMKPIYKHIDGNLYVETIYKDGEPGHDYDVSQGRENPDFVDYFIKGMGAGGEFGDQYFGVMVQRVDGAMTAPTIQPPQGGGQSAADPFKIESRAQMDWITAQAAGGHTFENEHLIVVNDIDMGEYGFAPIGDASRPFNGSFDGDGYTISGLTVSGGDNRGLFGYIGSKGAVSDVVLEDVTVSGGNRTGGIAGLSFGLVSDCTVTGNVTGGSQTGGLVGENRGTVSQCVNEADIVASGSYVGGVVGDNYTGGTVIEASINRGSVTNTGNYTGGIAGYNSMNGTIKECENTATATVSGTTNVGGITGRNNTSAKVEGCINHASVTGTGDNVGGIAGISYSKISSSSNTGTVQGMDYTGGMVGYNNGAGAVLQIGCNMGDVNGRNVVGGLVGWNNSGALVQNAYAWCDVTGGNNNIGGVVGVNAATLHNTYHTAWINGKSEQKGRITGNLYVGGIAGRLNTNGTLGHSVSLARQIVGSGEVNKAIGIHSGGTYDKLYSSDTIIVNTVSNGVAGEPVQNPPYFWWSAVLKGSDSNTGDSYAGDFADPNIWVWDAVNNLPVLKAFNNELTAQGTGSAQSPYLLTCRADMDALASAVNGGASFEGKHFRVENDFAMGSEPFTAIGTSANTFSGNVDGNGKTISGLKIDSELAGQGLFGYVTAGTIKSLNLDGINVKSTKNTVGGLVGGLSSGAKAENCKILSGTVTGALYVGGLVGNNYAEVTGCENNAEVSGAAGVGGIVGYQTAAGTIAGCENNGLIKSDLATGGIVGVNLGAVNNCENKGTIEGASAGGGIAGQNTTGTITGCTNSGIINLTTYGGGIAGINRNMVTSCKNTGSVTSANMTITSYNGTGGIIGNNEGTVTGCENSGVITGGFYVGGIVGFNGKLDGTVNSTIESSRNLAGGTVEGLRMVGGLAGFNSAAIRSSTNASNVTAGNNDNYSACGGIAGINMVYAYSIIESCSNSGNVLGSGQNVGGIVGNNANAIKQSFSIGEVTGGTNTGGVAGMNSGTVSNCYSWSDITGTGNNVGGVAGHNAGTVSKCYHAEGTIRGNVSVAGLIGTQPSESPAAVTENCVAFSASVTGGISTDARINRLIGALGGGTLKNSYYWQEMPLNGTGGGNGTGLTQIVMMVQAWWEDTHPTIRGPGFDFTTVWRWENTNSLPVLRGVTP